MFVISLISEFVVKARSLPFNEAPKCATLGYAPALLANIRLDWKGLPGTNNLAYHEHM